MSVTRSDDHERLRRQRMRSLAIGLALGALVVLFYVATIVRLGPNALRKDLGTSTSQPRPAAGGATDPQADCKRAGTC